MPVKVEKVDGYRVTHGGKTSAKRTTKTKAKRQANLLRAVEHGWKPTGKAARKKKSEKTPDVSEAKEYVKDRVRRRRKKGGL